MTSQLHVFFLFSFFFHHEKKHPFQVVVSHELSDEGVRGRTKVLEPSVKIRENSSHKNEKGNELNVQTEVT